MAVAPSLPFRCPCRLEQELDRYVADTRRREVQLVVRAMHRGTIQISCFTNTKGQSQAVLAILVFLIHTYGRLMMAGFIPVSVDVVSTRVLP